MEFVPTVLQLVQFRGHCMKKIQCKVLNREEATLNIGRICLVYTIAAPPVWKCKTKTKMSYKCDMSLSFTFQLNSTFPKLLVQNKIDL